ncbi:MAG: type II 3-dehydroquinate dehydratase [Oscillospiraceae bacterium]
MKFYIINGPNLNMLGVREPAIYGKITYGGLCEYVKEKAMEQGHEVAFFQSNHEGDIVDAIQSALGVYDAIVINPAAYTHTSIAILDALKAVALPCAEVHISDVTKREAYRQISYAGEACCCHFIGQGIEGYVNAIKALAEKAVK